MQKNIQIDGVNAPIILARRKGTRSLRISIKSDGSVRVGVPYGIPDFMAKKFVESKIDWINEHVKPRVFIGNNAHIGKNHQVIISITESLRHSTRITSTEIKISLPESIKIKSIKGQNIIRIACEKALQMEAETLLLQRLEYISHKHGITYNSGSIKKLKSRWGACDNRNNISLNSYLIQLDWKLIDYVISHELAHTKHHHHHPSFWEFLSTIYPDYKIAKKEIKTKPTDIITSKY